MKRVLLVAFLLIIVALLVGCGGGENSPVVGVWERDNWLYEFNSDGTIVVTLNENANSAGTGTWSVNDNRLTLSRTNQGVWFPVNSYTFSFRDGSLILREQWGDEMTLTRVE